MRPVQFFTNSLTRGDEYAISSTKSTSAVMLVTWMMPSNASAAACRPGRTSTAASSSSSSALRYTNAASTSAPKTLTDVATRAMRSTRSSSASRNGVARTE